MISINATASLLLSGLIQVSLSLCSYAEALEQWVPPSSVNKLMESSDSGYDLRDLSRTDDNSSVLTSVSPPSQNVLELRALRLDNRNLHQTTKTLADDNLKLKNKLEELTSQLSHSNNNLLDLQKRLSESQSAMSAMRKQDMDRKNKQESTTLIPDTNEHRQAYVVGQAMAVGLRTKLNGYAQSGLKLEKEAVLSGLTDGLIDRMQLSREEMDQQWSKFSDELQAHIDAKVKESEALLLKKTVGRKPVLSVDGVQYFLVKKGMEMKDNNMPRTLSLSEINTTDQRVISQVPHLVLGSEDEMPTIIRDALPLLGPGAEVEVYALARSIYGDRPLPKGVAPFSVLHYRMKGLEPMSN
ncbi:FKBP-type peptidyl-prolyl cis-trans isomerase N-terminal domain-containing protein [Enterobacter cloacae]|uniref:FKBP-type peptidyl-prolyl cis-trans isomerase N-terminal domain-containing protein n=1 Tax=Enterobacter cloacae TaxID=550 RepID=UPI00335444C6